MKCQSCYKEAKYCEECFNKYFFEYISCKMEGDLANRIKFMLEEKLQPIEEKVDNLEKSIKDFKIRGLHLKSLKKKSKW